MAITGKLMRRTIGETIIDGLSSILLARRISSLVLMFAAAIPVPLLTGRIDLELAKGFATSFYLRESVLTGGFGDAASILSHTAIPMRRRWRGHRAVTAAIASISMAAPLNSE